MPCYTAWNEYLTVGTPAYDSARRRVAAQLDAIRHIVDYYYAAFGLRLPSLPLATVIDPTRRPRSRRELKVREMICHHFACDEVRFVTLYDVCSLLDARDERDRAYLAVLETSAHWMRSEYERFHPAPSAGERSIEES